ncbi:MAG: 2-oxoacid:ferredoxin oxidoreductase subunit beta, partial [Polyangia bacterium]
TMHDGSVVKLSKVSPDYDYSNRQNVLNQLREIQTKGEVPTGLLFMDTNSVEMHELAGTIDVPLSRLPFEKLCPGAAKLDALQEAFR